MSACARVVCAQACAVRRCCKTLRAARDKLQAILADPEFAAGPVSTRWLEESFLRTWAEQAP